MSTRCSIVIHDPEENRTVLLYKHEDGYPEGKGGMLYAISKIVRHFMEHRGYFEVAYLGARMMHGLIEAERDYFREVYGKRIAEAEAEGDKEEAERWGESLKYQLDKVTGYGILPFIPGDVDFVYVVTPTAIHVHNGRVEFKLRKNGAPMTNKASRLTSGRPCGSPGRSPSVTSSGTGRGPAGLRFVLSRTIGLP